MFVLDYFQGYQQNSNWLEHKTFVSVDNTEGVLGSGEIKLGGVLATLCGEVLEFDEFALLEPFQGVTSGSDVEEKQGWDGWSSRIRLWRGEPERRRWGQYRPDPDSPDGSAPLALG